MKILFITRTFYPGEGDSNYTFRLESLLKEHGHEVGFFSSENPRNISSPYSKYFVSQFVYGDRFRQKGLMNSFKIICRSLYSVETKNKIKRLIEDFKPDIVHVQHLDTHISPSILPIIKEYNIPIVYTLNVYTPLCINSTFIDRRMNCICEACKPKKFYQIFAKRCVKGSLPASALGMFFQYFNYLSGFYDCVDCFICPSAFVKNKFIEYGFSPDRFHYLPYFFDAHGIVPRFDGDGYGLFLGRLVPEKGVDILLRALQGTDIPFKIVGSGESMQALISLAGKLGLKNVEFLGHRLGDELFKIVSGANFVVVPSKWFEVVGLVTLEAFAYGKPVIGSRMGGISEVISDEETGFLFDPVDVGILQERMIALYSNPEHASRMGRKARLAVEGNYSTSGHYVKLTALYNSLLVGN